MIRFGEQILHLAISINHVIFRALHVISKSLYCDVLTFNSCAKVLCLVLGGFDNIKYISKLIILFSNHVLLMLEELSAI